jgi:hypothetical protein
MRTTWKHRAAYLVVVLAASLGTAFHASAGAAVPFKGHAAVVITGVDGNHLSTSGTGQATHLGRFTRTEDAFLHEDGTLDGTLVITAANGDQLFVEFVGAFTAPTTAEGTYTISGGTGRFSDASGEAEFAASTADGMHFTIEFEGAISF